MNFTNLKAFFDALPSACLILLPDFPRFTIVGANSAYCRATNTLASDLINKGLFEAFPDNPNDLEANGEEMLRASLDLVIATKLAHKMDVQKYDIPVRNSEAFEVKYWSTENSPVINDLGEIEVIIHNATDVTERIKADEQRKIAEQLIRESEAKYSSIIESSMDGILLTVEEGQILEANQAACEIFKMTRAEICDAGRLGLVDITDPRLQILLEERKKTGRATGELIFKRKDGSTFSGEISSVVFTDAQGGARTSMTIRDITERKLADQKLTVTSNALNQTLGDLNRIMDSSVDIICSIDEEGRFVNVSAASEAIWGYRLQELTGRKFMDFVFSEDVLHTISVASEIMNGVPVTMFENRYVHKDGRAVPLLWSARWDDEDRLMYCTAKDATEKKKSEKAFEVERQWFHDLYSQAPSCMGIIKGPNHVYELANPLYLQLIGKADIIGKTVKEVLPELEAQGIFEFLDTVYTTGETFSANEMLFKFDLQGTGELSDFYLNLIYQAHRDHEGAIDGIFFFVVDVTEQVLARIKIEENEEHYRSLFNHHPDAVFSFDLEGNFLSANPGAAKLAECSVEELLRITFLPLILPEDSAKVLEHFIKASNGEIQNYDTELITTKGNRLMLNVTNLPIIINKEIIGVYGIAKDITEIKATEQHLKLLESVITHTNDAVMITEAEPFDEPGPRILYVNEAFTKMTGYSSEEVVGKSPRILQGPKTDLEELKRMSQSMRRWEPCEVTIINYKKNGEEFWVNFSISPVANEKGWFTHWISIERDVTESKRIEQKISDERALLRTLIDNLPDTIYFKDEFARKLISNKVDYELLGAATEEEVLHKTDLEVLQNDLTISGYHQDIEVLSTGRSIVNIEQYFIRENGSTSCFLTTKIPLRNKQGEIVGLLGIGRDITEKKHHETALKLNELRFKALVQEGSDLICILDEKRLYTYVSPAYTSMLGIKNEELIGVKALDRIHEDDQDRVSQTTVLLMTEKRVQYLPYRYRISDGEYRWLESIGTNLLDDPSVKGILLNSKDITDRMNHIQAIEDQNSKLREIAWIQSHLVRAPVARILGLVDLIKNYKDRINEAELLNHIYDSTKELDLLIKNIVDKTEKVI